jgi:hypothetical protein
MGRNAAWLSEKQVGVLDWIKDGCPSVDPEVDYGRRITARALHRRGLVTIKGSGASWTASITKPGLAWQEAHPAKLGDAQVDDLIGRVQAAGGRLGLPGGRDVETANKELVRISDRSPTRPKGWRLKLYNAGSWAEPRYEVVLVRHFDDLVEAVPVPVPRHVTRYHPTIRAFVSEKKSHEEVSKAYLDRAARIFQAIADEAPRRGITVLTAEQARSVVDRHQYQTIRGCRLALRSSEDVYAIRIKELSASPGNLELVVYGPGASYNGDRYRDTKTISVEDRLPQLFRALEIYRLRAELRVHEREREAAERRRRWEAAMAEARVRQDERARWDAFEQSSSDWHAVNRHREFLAAARDALVMYQGQEREGIVAQLAFAELRLDQLDPIGNPERILPEIRDPKPDDLKPYLHGWSPYGPDSSV